MKIQVGTLLFNIDDDKKIREILEFIADRVEEIPQFGCKEIPANLFYKCKFME